MSEKLDTTDGRSVDVVRAEQRSDPPTGQHRSYIILSDEERAKGFIRPYRDSYRHAGLKQEEPQKPVACPSCCAGESLIRPANIDPLKWLCLDCGHVWKLAKPGARVGGCGAVTTMGRKLSETYAVNPKFYSHTFCAGCNTHLPVAEFVWTKDGEEVGS